MFMVNWQIYFLKASSDDISSFAETLLHVTMKD